MHLQKPDFLPTPNYTKIVDITRNSGSKDLEGLSSECVKHAQTAELVNNVCTIVIDNGHAPLQFNLCLL